MKRTYLYIGAAVTLIGMAVFIFRPASVDKETARLTELISKNPADALLRRSLGMRHLGRGDYKAAEDELLAAMNIEPYNTDILQSVGMLYYRKGEPHKALTYWRSLLEIDPGNTFIWELVNKVSAKENGGEVSHNAGGSVVNPEWERLYMAGQNSYQAKDYAKAVVAFKKAAQINQDDFRTYFNIGASYYEMHDLVSAKEYWEKALKLKKDDMLVKRLISLTEQGMDRQGFIADVSGRLKKEPGNWELHVSLADAYGMDKATAGKAEKEYLEVLRLNPDNTDIYRKLIELSLRLGEWGKAEDYSGMLLKKRPQDAEALRQHDSLKRLKKLFDDGKVARERLGAAGYMGMTPVIGINGIALLIDSFEATNHAYNEFLRSSGHLPPPAWDATALKGKENVPVTNVSWYDAVTFCKWVGKRLPTEEEWTQAALGGTKTTYPWGNGFDAVKANTSESNLMTPVPVGSFPAQHRLYDMAGNVSEWTATTIGGAYVKKGGSFLSAAQESVASAKQMSQPGERDGATGFRCVKDR